MLTLHTDTFIPAETPSEYAVKYGWNEGTVEVTFMNRTRRVPCRAPSETKSNWSVFGLCARYATGSKVWHASIIHNGERVILVSTGFQSRSGRHSQPRLVGFTAEVSEAHVSKR